MLSRNLCLCLGCFSKQGLINDQYSHTPPLSARTCVPACGRSLILCAVWVQLPVDSVELCDSGALRHIPVENLPIHCPSFHCKFSSLASPRQTQALTKTVITAKLRPLMLAAKPCYAKALAWIKSYGLEQYEKSLYEDVPLCCTGCIR